MWLWRLQNQPLDDITGIESPENLWTYTNAERKAILHSISQKNCEKVHKIFFNSYSDPINSEDEVHTYC